MNGQHSSWADVVAGVPQGLNFGQLFFLTYINDLSDDLTTIAKLFVDNASIFSIVKSIDNSEIDLSNNTINEWAFSITILRFRLKK